MTDIAIEVDSLTKAFGKFTAVDRLSFRVRRGDIFGFLGANGAGKSTTIRMLCGLLRSTSGTARVGDYDINAQAEMLKSNIGYMSQKFSLYDDLTVEQNIRFFGGVYGLRGKDLTRRMGWVLEMAGLRGRETSLTRALSGGYKQRLALGCAVLHEPPVLFLDEPTGGVDPLSRRRFWELIDRLSRNGVTILVTTHFLDEAEYCNEIVLIDAGKLLANGSPSELKRMHIRDPILEVRTGNTVAALRAIEGKDWVLETSVFGTKLHVMVAEERQGTRRISEALASAGIRADSIQRIVPSLEDVFLHLLESPRSGT
jgi:ABC-2 type transport system ATP-binding protein